MKYSKEYADLKRGEWIEWLLILVCIVLAIENVDVGSVLMLFVSMLFGALSLLFQKRRVDAFWSKQRAFSEGIQYAMDEIKAIEREKIVTGRMN